MQRIAGWVLLLAVLVVVEGLNLEVQVLYNGKPAPRSMYLRGDNLGLNWESGLLMTSSSNNLWTLTLSYNSTQVGTRYAMESNETSLPMCHLILISPQSSDEAIEGGRHMVRGRELHRGITTSV